MSSNNVINGIKKAKQFVDDAKEDAVYDHDSQLIYNTQCEDLRNMVHALLYVETSNKVIIRLMLKYYDITMTKAERILDAEKTVFFPAEQFEDYLCDEKGYTRESAQEYITNNRLYQRLRRDRQLWQKNNDDIYKLLESEKNE